VAWGAWGRGRDEPWRWRTDPRGYLEHVAGQAWSRISLGGVDLVCSTLLAVLVGASVLVWHTATQASVLPFGDGAHHVANVASRAAEVKTHGPGALFSAGVQDVSLAYLVLVLPSLVLGGGRLAFGVVWAGCLVAILIAVWGFFRGERHAPVRTLALGLFLTIGLFQSEFGGAWDTRIDLLSISLAYLGLIAITRARPLDAGLLLCVSAFAKTAAVSLVLPAGLLGLAFFPPRIQRSRPAPAQVVKMLTLVLAAWVFTTQLGAQAVFYNLMAAGGTTVSERSGLFVANVAQYLTREPGYYLRELRTTPHAWVVILAGVLLLAWGAWRGWSRDLLRSGAYALTVFGYAYLLLTLSPLHSNVLTVWLLPGLGLVALFVARALARQLRPGVVAALATLLVAWSLPSLRLAPASRSPQVEAEIRATYMQAAELGEYLDQHLDDRAAPVVVMTNFLFVDDAGPSTFDEYRVLVQERLRGANLIIDGWELGSWSLDWRPALQAAEGYANVVFVLQENPALIESDNFPQRAGQSVWEAMQRFRAAHPECLAQVARSIQIREAGRRDVLMLDHAAGCRQALFTPQA
jgi:hypothetical protein